METGAMHPRRILAAIVGLTLLPCASLAQETPYNMAYGLWFCIQQEEDGAAGDPKEGRWFSITPEGFGDANYPVDFPFTGFTALGTPYSATVLESDHGYERRMVTMTDMKSYEIPKGKMTGTLVFSRYEEDWVFERFFHVYNKFDCSKAPTQ
jgi:hypothetical protein